MNSRTLTVPNYHPRQIEPHHMTTLQWHHSIWISTELSAIHRTSSFTSTSIQPNHTSYSVYYAYNILNTSISTQFQHPNKSPTTMRLAHLHLPNITPFTRVSHIQETLTSRLLAYKKHPNPASSSPNARPTPPDPTIITFTPNPVYTTGRRDLPPSNTPPQSQTAPLSLPPPLEPIRPLLTSYPSGKAIADYHPTLRGGQTTYHGPGQMVGYTILDLRRLGLTPRCHIRVLENSVVDVLRSYGVRGVITEDPGVWVPSGSGSGSGGSGSGRVRAAKKITAVGVHLRRNISSFGIGFNVTEEPMWYFRQIVACGLEGREATSLEGVGVKGVGVDEVADRFVAAFVERVNRDFACDQGGRLGERIESVYRIGEEDVD